MRDIKFRAWDNHGSMREVFGLDKHSLYFDEGPPKDGIYGEEPTITRDARSAWVLMQYTGLKDRNGIEIYEGDILDLDSGSESDCIGAVIFEYGCFCYKADWIKDGQHYPELKAYTEISFCDVEVIGNIYENPELLNE